MSLTGSPGQAPKLQATLLVAEPVQSLPPYCGAGSVQVLVCWFVPGPQDTEQPSKLPYVLHPPCIGAGQTWVLQVTFSVGSPTQGAPPFSGAGLVHVRVREV